MLMSCVNYGLWLMWSLLYCYYGDVKSLFSDISGLGSMWNEVCVLSLAVHTMAEDRHNRRYPQNLQGVLQLAVDAGSATGPAPPEPMSEEVSSLYY